jgi:hypothetical protein
MTAVIFRSICTVAGNQRPPIGPLRSSRPSHPHHDRPSGKRGGGAGTVRAQLRLPPIQIADFFRRSQEQIHVARARRLSVQGWIPCLISFRLQVIRSAAKTSARAGVGLACTA